MMESKKAALIAGTIISGKEAISCVQVIAAPVCNLIIAISGSQGDRHGN